MVLRNEPYAMTVAPASFACDSVDVIGGYSSGWAVDVRR